MESSPRAQTMSKSKAVEALTEARYDLNAAEKRYRQAQDDVQAALNAREAARARVDDAQSHLDRAIAKEIG
jgi:hypothetical protein